MSLSLKSRITILDTFNFFFTEKVHSPLEKRLTLPYIVCLYLYKLYIIQYI